MEEKWTKYKNKMVSNLGRVKGAKGKLIKGTVRYDGYVIVDGKGLHRIVWEAFNGPIPKGMEINHMDEDKKNNYLSNLSLVTHRENMNWGTVRQRISKKLSKPIVMYRNEDDCFRLQFGSYKKAGEILGHSGHHIADAASGKRRKAYGYFWKYA